MSGASTKPERDSERVQCSSFNVIEPNLEPNERMIAELHST